MKQNYPFSRIESVCEQSLYDGLEINSPNDAITLVAKYLLSYPTEMSLVIYVDSNNTPICVSIVGRGDRCTTVFDIQQIATLGILTGASSYILVHNHPDVAPKTKDLKASEEDLLSSEDVCKACNPLGLSCLDSIVVGNIWEHGLLSPSYYSIRHNQYYELQKDFLKKKAVLISAVVTEKLDSSMRLPVIRLSFCTHKFLTSEPLLGPKIIKEIIMDDCLNYRQALDFVIFSDHNQLPICYIIPKETNGADRPFDPVAVAVIGLLCNANYFDLVHQEPEKESYKLYIKSGNAMKFAESIAKVSAPLGIFLYDNIIFQISKENIVYPPKYSEALHHMKAVEKMNGFQKSHGIITLDRHNEGNIPWNEQLPAPDIEAMISKYRIVGALPNQSCQSSHTGSLSFFQKNT